MEPKHKFYFNPLIHFDHFSIQKDPLGLSNRRGPGNNTAGDSSGVRGGEGRRETPKLSQREEGVEEGERSHDNLLPPLMWLRLRLSPHLPTATTDA